MCTIQEMSIIFCVIDYFYIRAVGGKILSIITASHFVVNYWLRKCLINIGWINDLTNIIQNYC